MLIKRFVRLIIKMISVLWILSTITFILMKLTPGDLVVHILHVGEANVSQSTINATRQAYGLNDQWLIQYGRWLGHVLHFDFGESYQTHEPVLKALIFHAQPTIMIAILTIMVVMMTALPLGTWAGCHPNSKMDRLIRITTSMTVSLPSFFLGIVLIHIFAVRLNILPASGYTSPIHLVLPVMAMSIGMSAYYIRLMRSTVMNLYQSREVAASRLRGVSERYIFFTDILKPALVPVVTILGLSIGSLVGGTVVIERVFSIPGLGQFLVDSVRARDYPVIQGIVLMMGVIVVLANMLSDMLILFLDPKQRLQHQKTEPIQIETAEYEVSSQ
ncbi:ABC transporter permease [Staphylococcus coagulans]|uniref:nickel ABC transporter permease n=1 Tax=Staphylococcus coagulans TaxID=74706 RepID=UPI00292958A6|nr:nickel ABC transporter permease [Staphylococcus coagulans]MDU9268679.1 ABC transporter permease [Staphylococcus coagulans]